MFLKRYRKQLVWAMVIIVALSLFLGLLWPLL